MPGELDVVILAESYRLGKLARQRDLIRKAADDAPVTVVCPPGTKNAPDGVIVTAEAQARSLSRALSSSASPFSLVLPLGVFPGARSIFPAEGSLVVVGGREGRESRPGVNEDGGLATHFAYGAALRWTGAFLLSAAHRELFLSLSSEHRRRHYLIHEVLNEMLARGAEILVRARTIDKSPSGCYTSI